MKTAKGGYVRKLKEVSRILNLCLNILHVQTVRNSSGNKCVYKSGCRMPPAIFNNFQLDYITEKRDVIFINCALKHKLYVGYNSWKSKDFIEIYT